MSRWLGIILVVLALKISLFSAELSKKEEEKIDNNIINTFYSQIDKNFNQTNEIEFLFLSKDQLIDIFLFDLKNINYNIYAQKRYIDKKAFFDKKFELYVDSKKTPIKNKIMYLLSFITLVIIIINVIGFYSFNKNRNYLYFSTYLRNFIEWYNFLMSLDILIFIFVIIIYLSTFELSFSITIFPIIITIFTLSMTIYMNENKKFIDFYKIIIKNGVNFYFNENKNNIYIILNIENEGIYATLKTKNKKEKDVTVLINLEEFNKKDKIFIKKDEVTVNNNNILERIKDFFILFNVEYKKIWRKYII